MFDERTIRWRGCSGAAAWAVAIALTMSAVGGVSVRVDPAEEASIMPASGTDSFALDVPDGAGKRPRGGPPAEVKEIVALSPDEDELKKNFNKDQGRVRLVLILSPT